MIPAKVMMVLIPSVLRLGYSSTAYCRTICAMTVCRTLLYHYPFSGIVYAWYLCLYYTSYSGYSGLVHMHDALIFVTFHGTKLQFITSYYNYLPVRLHLYLKRLWVECVITYGP